METNGAAGQNIDLQIETINAFLSQEDWQPEACISAAEHILLQHGLKFRILHFWLYTEYRLHEVHQQKLALVRERDFEQAAHLRDEEKKLLRIIEQRCALQLDCSRFVVSDGFLLFCYLHDNERAVELCALLQEAFGEAKT